MTFTGPKLRKLDPKASWSWCVSHRRCSRGCGGVARAARAAMQQGGPGGFKNITHIAAKVGGPNFARGSRERNSHRCPIPRSPRVILGPNLGSRGVVFGQSIPLCASQVAFGSNRERRPVVGHQLVSFTCYPITYVIVRHESPNRSEPVIRLLVANRQYIKPGAIGRIHRWHLLLVCALFGCIVRCGIVLAAICSGGIHPPPGPWKT